METKRELGVIRASSALAIVQAPPPAPRAVEKRCRHEAHVGHSPHGGFHHGRVLGQGSRVDRPSAPGRMRARAATHFELFVLGAPRVGANRQPAMLAVWSATPPGVSAVARAMPMHSVFECGLSMRAKKRWQSSSLPGEGEARTATRVAARGNAFEAEQDAEAELITEGWVRLGCEAARHGDLLMEAGVGGTTNFVRVWVAA